MVEDRGNILLLGKTRVFSVTSPSLMLPYNDHDSDGEADSLFGSPPPSPTLGIIRGGSPELALPGGQGETCPVLPALPKNVGTIALPGSHNCSELEDSHPVSPPAPHHKRPIGPTQQVQPQLQIKEWVGPGTTYIHATNPIRPKPTQKKRKAKPTTRDPRTIGSNSTPMPSSFKRQSTFRPSNVTGGINFAQLPSHVTRGLTKDNPIVVEEAPESSATHRTSNAFLPSSQSIADTLVSQGNLFPVLQSLMPFIGLSSNGGWWSGRGLQQYPCSSQESASRIKAPPLKKRKLNAVPAGAKDWDVPYPFPADEGPPNYLDSWKKKRGKKLMMRLVSLVREAVQKAAATTQVQEENPNPAPDPPPISPPEQIAPVMANDEPASGPVSSLSTSTAPAPEPQAAFSDLLSPSGNVDSWNFTSEFDSFLGAVNDALSDPDVQLTGNDLEMMSSYPFSPTLSSLSTLSSSTRLSTPCDMTHSPLADGKENDFTQFRDFNFDIPIDPTLFDSVWMDSSMPATQNSVDALLDLSPLGGELTDSTGSRSVSEIPGPASFLLGQVDYSANEDAPVASNATIVTADAQAYSPPTASESVISAQSTDSPQPSPHTPSQTIQQPVEPQSVVPVVNVPTHGKRVGASSSKKLDRQYILRRTRVRREQLAAEIARAKIELWETTIEQGVLTHLSKDKELQG